MATTRYVLGQLKPTAASLDDLYTVPGGGSTVVSSITVANQANAKAHFRISIAPGGAGDAVEQYIAYNAELEEYDFGGLTVGVTLGDGDVIRCYSTEGTVSFSAFGEESS